MDRKYTYFGPMSAVTLAADADHPGGRNVQLMRGLVVSLPEDNAYVASLVARKYLVPVEDKTATETKTTAAASATATETKTSTATSTAATTAASQTASTQTISATAATTASNAGSGITAGTGA